MSGEIDEKLSSSFLISAFVHALLFFSVISTAVKNGREKVFEISFLNYSNNSRQYAKYSGKIGGEEDVFKKSGNINLEKTKEVLGEYPGEITGDFPDDKRNNVYTLSKEPKIIGTFSPRYPIAARKMKKSGYVKVGIFIDETGKISSFSIIESSGEEFSKSVAEALKKAKFVPAIINGLPVKSYGVLPVKFQIED
ncbi:MAG: energy transducer TonB [Elusimicrobia bacterium]|nr:energy transducer TonB [Elusimicrobiota bacterium]